MGRFQFASVMDTDERGILRMPLYTHHDFFIADPSKLKMGMLVIEMKDAAGDDATEALLRAINDDGRVYLTQTRHRGRFVIRVQVGPFDTTRDDVMQVATVVAALVPRA